MIESLAPDVVILDIGLEKLDGLTVLKRITQAKENYAARCLQAGASGFVSKSEPIGKLIKAIEMVADGYVFFPKDSMPLLGNPEPTGDLEELTDRELQILRLLAEGFSNGEIASRLNLSNKTVSGHKVNIQAKLGVTSVIELADIARRYHLV
ncbi:Virulence factors putative positive transcription regulator BvgA [compost metagenome]